MLVREMFQSCLIFLAPFHRRITEPLISAGIKQNPAYIRSRRSSNQQVSAVVPNRFLVHITNLATQVCRVVPPKLSEDLTIELLNAYALPGFSRIGDPQPQMRGYETMFCSTHLAVYGR